MKLKTWGDFVINIHTERGIDACLGTIASFVNFLDSIPKSYLNKNQTFWNISIYFFYILCDTTAKKPFLHSLIKAFLTPEIIFGCQKRSTIVLL